MRFHRTIPSSPGRRTLTPALAPPEGFARLQGFGEDAAGELHILENCDPSEIAGGICPADAVDGGVYKIVSIGQLPSFGPLGGILLVTILATAGALAAPRG